MRSQTALALSGCLLGIAARVAAQDAFNTLDDGFVSSFGYDLLGGSTQLPSSIAWRFTSAANGPVTTLYVRAYRTSGPSVAATMSVYQAAGTEIGALLGGVELLLPDAPNYGPVWAFPSGITLTQGTDYFFALSVPPGVGAHWRSYGPPFTPGPEAYWLNGSWSYTSGPEVYYPGFRVEARCPANCDGSTTDPILNVLDFNCFIGRFMMLDPYGNCDGSTATPVFNVLDFNCFLNSFAAGCP